jgi:hypothetical protein
MIIRKSLKTTLKPVTEKSLNFSKAITNPHKTTKKQPQKSPLTIKKKNKQKKQRNFTRRQTLQPKTQTT